MSTVFQFKQFSITQDRSAMKVGTDGVLLGSWTQLENVRSVLDVGAGTGLVSLMVAQRSVATITAIEVDSEACINAQSNFTNSPWDHRLQLINEDVNAYVGQSFDLVISNPPFFVNGYKEEVTSRTTARHDDGLSFVQLLAFVIRSKSKRLAVIYPYERLKDIEQTVQSSGWNIARIGYVYPTPTKKCSRVLIEITSNTTERLEEKIIVEEFGRHHYSQSYIDLTKDFYLKM